MTTTPHRSSALDAAVNDAFDDVDLTLTERYGSAKHPERPVERARAAQLDDATALGSHRGRLYHDGEPGIDGDMGTRPQAAARPHQRLPAVVAEVAEEEDLGAASSLAPSQEAGGEHAASVHDEEIARAQKAGKVAEDVVGRRPLRPRQAHEPRLVARLDRFLGNGGRWQVVVEVRDPHAPSAARAGGKAGAQKSFFWFGPGPPSGRARPKCS